MGNVPILLSPMHPEPGKNRVDQKNCFFPGMS